ncbi:hypothetical protein DPMN_155307 [Dreissena polymorpha]|uniref:LRAT domain-containing protein n=1 Tax=Dreissena polymorpha TaxID=45954 RepID=A0A9D4J9V8_DREPO|nr:hypothetical protein DPMN_155307 [Dreissena polymorpha]
MGNSSGSSSGSNGGWKSYVRYRTSNDERNVNNHEFSSITDDSDDTILEMWIHKTNLFHIQLTSLILHHAFIVMRGRRWWWSIEKHSDGITLQRHSCEREVKEYFRGDRRSIIDWVTCLSKKSTEFRISSLMTRLSNEQEVYKGYDTVNSNCQHFAYRVFNWY